MASESAQYLATLHKQIDQYFSFNEIKTICFDLGVDYENIPGNIRSAFIRNLIVSLAKQNRLQELVGIVRAERPFLDWQDVPANFELLDTIAQEDIRQVVNYTVYGDVVHGDKIAGDRISVGNISGGEGIAIGSGASANVTKTTTHTTPAQTTPTTSSPVISRSNDAIVQQTAARLQQYLALIPESHQATVDEFSASITLIQNAAAQPIDALHLKLLCLGLLQITADLADSIPQKVVDDFVTAVLHGD